MKSEGTRKGPARVRARWREESAPRSSIRLTRPPSGIAAALLRHCCGIAASRHSMSCRTLRAWRCGGDLHHRRNRCGPPRPNRPRHHQSKSSRHHLPLNQQAVAAQSVVADRTREQNQQQRATTRSSSRLGSRVTIRWLASAAIRGRRRFR